MLNKDEMNSHNKDIQSKKWHHDIMSLTNEDINLILSNLLYQTFMVEVDNINLAINTNESGCHVNISLSGEAYRDSENVNYLDEDEYEEEDEEEE